MHGSPDPKDPIYRTDAHIGTDNAWSEIEVCVAIICAYLPTLRALRTWSLHKRRDFAGSDRVNLALGLSVNVEDNRVNSQVVDD